MALTTIITARRPEGILDSPKFYDAKDLWCEK